MNIELIGHALEYFGTILVAYTVLKVHMRVRMEHKIDEAVFSEMRKEQVMGLIGILLISIGFVMQLPFKL